jgi:hypothetical protein
LRPKNEANDICDQGSDEYVNNDLSESGEAALFYDAENDVSYWGEKCQKSLHNEHDDTGHASRSVEARFIDPNFQPRDGHHRSANPNDDNQVPKPLHAWLLFNDPGR